ncbi:pyrroline-5-carboxylate reductase [Xanthomonas oryzae pv. oryzicola]|uniref:Pyrroline-5-carboxylate reductase n=1 Tax=Xanthomonas oryzae pv. oryzicola (strain BLS256) TaxID=383407 RepID=G7TLB7_XANOB|nr:pyrroline-5-carboxylate reductase [Xanthomonas oryzae pv. oryzicola BLS256]AJQ86040.1 pyrroline-5-carboxylate reductase [Xanthomonas oryzae pv. oryzicola]KOR39742.1 pyrroline-5-carboxylate reductase [Xanthomonas oryzae]AKK65577.1 pyrroline-5-carboxylate reductase [Xanthomonas oryzae pv. oryzicola]AKN91974.1 pyrroline-5-carboxylate reductase [Xanthomonas oryzae pv. oryzicola]
MHEQPTIALLVGVDVPIDPCVTGQAGAAGNLFGTDVLPQQNLDLADALGVDAWTPAGLRAPMGADALRVIGPILRSVLVATQFAADRAGRTSELKPPPVDRRL